MPTLLIDELNVYYELHGKGQPLVLIAGYTCDHSFWGLMIEELKQHFQVLIFDNRAVGQTIDKQANFSLETMADDTIKLIQKLNLEKPHILGQSMGGAIAQIIAKKYPQRINKLVILNSSFKFNQRTNLLCEALLNARIKGVDLESLVELSMFYFLGTTFLSNSKQYIEFKKNLLNYPFLQTAFDQKRQFEALISFDSSSWLKELNLPTLIISSTEDIITLPEESNYLAEKINGAKWVSVSGGHSSPLEAYKQVNRHLLSFLK